MFFYIILYAIDRTAILSNLSMQLVITFLLSITKYKLIRCQVAYLLSYFFAKIKRA